MNAQRLQQKIAELKNDWDILSERLSRSREARVIETDENVKFKLEKQVEQIERERAALERQLNDLEKQLAGLNVSQTQTPEVEQPLIPGCACDIFVSYAQADDEQQWVSATIDHLKHYLEADWKRGQSLVWRPYPEYAPEAVAAVAQSATVLLIFSQNYLQSSWSRADAREFLAAVQRRVQAGGKIFLIVLDDAERLPQFGNFPSYPFWTWDEPKHGARTLPLPGESIQDALKYRTQLFELSNDLYAELQDLLNRAETRRQLEHAGVVIDNHAVDKPLAKRVAQKVQQRGVGYISPVPQSAPGKSAADNRQEFEETVLTCNGLLMVYGVAPEQWLVIEVNRLRQIFAKHQRQPQAYAIYDGPPEEKQFPEPFSFPGFILNCRRCRQLDQDCRNCPGEKQFAQFIERLKG